MVVVSFSRLDGRVPQSVPDDVHGIALFLAEHPVGDGVSEPMGRDFLRLAPTIVHVGPYDSPDSRPLYGVVDPLREDPRRLPRDEEHRILVIPEPEVRSKRADGSETSRSIEFEGGVPR